MQKVQNGLTLIELLIVLAIIAALAAICIPVFSQTRVPLASCAYNEKQIANAIAVYNQDYDGRWIDWYPNYNENNPARSAYPANGPFWSASRDQPNAPYLLQDYVTGRQIFNCPLQTQVNSSGTLVWLPKYALNELDSQAVSFPGHTPPDYKPATQQWAHCGPFGRLDSQLTHPATTIDMWEHNNSSLQCNTWSTSPAHWFTGHNGGFNVTFADGHVKPWTLALLTNRLVCYWNLP